MKLAVFYHCRISGGHSQSGLSVNTDHAKNTVREQMALLVSSGLYDASNEIYVGVNGDDADLDFVAAHVPDGTKILHHRPPAESLLPTMNFMHEWAKAHPTWLVCFFHAKGATHPGDALIANWRRCLEHHVIERWDRCVADLESGQFDAVGVHWMTREQFGPIINPEHGGTPHFGGVFWWATAKYLAGLPALPRTVTCKEDFFWPEHFCGSGPTPPRVKDYHSGWPNLHACLTSSQQ